MTTRTKTSSGEWGLRFVFYFLAVGLVLEAVGLARLDLNTARAVAPTPSVGTPSEASPTTDFLPTLTEIPALEAWKPFSTGDLPRLADLHTDIPTRPRYDIVEYTAVKNDTVFGIAAKYNLKPETLLWANPALAENPNSLFPGQTVNILPTDGALRVVLPEDKIDKIAQVFHVTVEDIVNYPGNELDPADPQLRAGQKLILPGGWRELITWQLPSPPGRSTSGRTWAAGEPGACSGPFSGPVGTYTFAWPTNNHYLSGTDYIANGHPGIDIAAGMGAPIYASDTGVIVFDGWSTRGYGNLIIIDHGNGWQTAYAHLSQMNVACGTAAYQGQLIGLAGSTGNSTGAHLHFEMRNTEYGKVNPWLYLP